LILAPLLLAVSISVPIQDIIVVVFVAPLFFGSAFEVCAINNLLKMIRLDVVEEGFRNGKVAVLRWSG